MKLRFSTRLFLAVSASMFLVSTRSFPPIAEAESNPMGNDYSMLIKDGVMPESTPIPPPVALQVDPIVSSPLEPTTVQQTAPSLGIKELTGSELTRKWDEEMKHLPTPGADGKVIYNFGETLPAIVCSPFKVCDIELEAGEIITNGGVFIGDSVRFDVPLTTSGSEGNLTPHIIVKPKEANVETTLIVTTDRRSYFFRLISNNTHYMARVGFVFPDSQDRQRASFYLDQEAKAAKYRAQVKRSYSPPSPPADKLDFNYSIEGKAPWKPLRVYNDGRKTYIDMPTIMQAHEAPALIVIGEEGNEQQVNYRLQGNRYKVDFMITKAVMVLGSGDAQTRVYIEQED
jgi:type IV secretion system protein TrbG